MSLLNDTNTDLVLDEIDDVQQSTWLLLKTRFKNTAIATLVFSSIMVIVGFYITLADNNGLILIVLAILPPFFLYGYIGKKVEQLFMEQFAKSNGYDYQSHGTLIGKDAHIFSIGNSKKVFNEINGTYRTCPINLFDYQFTVGSGKNSQTYLKTIFSIDFQSPVPHITLRIHSILNALDWISQEKKINLEGDFNNKFDLYVQKGYEMEALEIFTPDLMQQIETQWQFELEFSATKLYILYPQIINKKVDLQNLFTAAKYFADHLDPLVNKMKSDMAAMMEQTAKK
jgi:hypothetical protein